MEIEGNILYVHTFQADYDALPFWYFFEQYIFFLKATFKVSLGEFDDLNLEDYNNQDWLVFFFCCIFNIIVLLNLLIAIISETYDKISKTSLQTAYREKVFFMSLM